VSTVTDPESAKPTSLPSGTRFLGSFRSHNLIVCHTAGLAISGIEPPPLSNIQATCYRFLSANSTHCFSDQRISRSSGRGR